MYSQLPTGQSSEYSRLFVNTHSSGFLYSHLLTIQYKQRENKGQSVHRLVNSVSILIITQFFMLYACKKCDRIKKHGKAFLFTMHALRNFTHRVYFLTLYTSTKVDTRESGSLKGQSHQKSTTNQIFFNSDFFRKIVLAQNSDYGSLTNQ